MKFFKRAPRPAIPAAQPVQALTYQAAHTAAQAAGQFNPWFRKEGK